MVDRGGNRADEFAQLLSAYEPRLFGYIYALTLNTADAEDIYQDTAMALWRKFDEYRPGTNFAAWARAAARFEIQHHFRRLSRRRVHFDQRLLEELAETQSSLDVPPASTVDSYTEALRHCKDLLPEGDRELIDLCYGGHAQHQPSRPAARPLAAERLQFAQPHTTGPFRLHPAGNGGPGSMTANGPSSFDRAGP